MTKNVEKLLLAIRSRANLVVELNDGKLPSDLADSREKCAEIIGLIDAALIVAPEEDLRQLLENAA